MSPLSLCVSLCLQMSLYRVWCVFLYVYVSVYINVSASGTVYVSVPLCVSVSVSVYVDDALDVTDNACLCVYRCLCLRLQIPWPPSLCLYLSLAKGI